MTREEAIQFLKTKPYKFGHLLGFTKLNPLHNKWIIKMLRGEGDSTLQASRGTYKTTCVSIALALVIILLPTRRTMFMRKTDTDVKEIIKQVQKILEDPHTQYFIQTIYGINLVLNTKSATEISTNLVTDLKGTAQLIGRGIKGSLTGKHFDLIFTDDIVNVDDRISKAERDYTKTVYMELQNIKNRGGRIFNTGTPWHAEDCFSIMPKAEKFDCYNPEIKKIISDTELEDIKSKIVPSLFAANYELRFIASEEVIFENPQTGADPVLCEQGTMQVDAAYYGEDFTAWSIVKKHDGILYVYGRMRRKHIQDCYGLILEDYQRFKCGKIFNEENADKGFAAKEMRKLGMKVVTYPEHQNKYLKIVTHLRAAWKNVVFVQGTDDEYINQICDYYEEAEHDDAPDSLASLIRAVGHKSENGYKPLWN